MIKNRILFYVHFNRYDKLDEYVVYQLKQLRKLFDQIVFITNSKISQTDKNRLSGLYDKFIERKNVGFDFAAWRDGMDQFGWSKLVKFNELTIMNDTCFGPVSDFAKIYHEMNSRSVDFWGIASNIALKHVITSEYTGEKIDTPSHIQSFYVTFSSKVIQSTAFITFWKNIAEYSKVNDVILNLELNLTNKLVQAGFTYDAYFNAEKFYKSNILTEESLTTKHDSKNDFRKYDALYSYSRPMWLLNSQIGYPFIKTKVVLTAPDQVSQIREFIINNTNYPIELIDKYIANRYVDNINDFVHAKNIELRAQNKKSQVIISDYNRIITQLNNQLLQKNAEINNLNGNIKIRDDNINKILRSRSYMISQAITVPLHKSAGLLTRWKKSIDNIDRRYFFAKPDQVNKKSDLAVVVHLYYTDMWPNFVYKLKDLEKTIRFDLFISIVKEQKDFTSKILKDFPLANVFIVPNLGRDVLPFLKIGKILVDNKYKYLLKIHSKKSKHINSETLADSGERWFNDTLKLIVGGDVGVILNKLQLGDTGVIGSDRYYYPIKVGLGTESPILDAIIAKTSREHVDDKILNDYGFFAGTMFWARVDAIDSLFNIDFQFQEERGQVSGTTAHALERAFSLVPELGHRTMYSIDNTGIQVRKYHSYNIPEWYKSEEKND